MRDWITLPLSPDANTEYLDEEISLWDILLAVVGLRKLENKQHQPSRQIQSYTEPTSNSYDEMICNGVEMTDDEDEEDEEEEDDDENNDNELNNNANNNDSNYTPLKRTLSCSSIASSIASETSTAASSHADEVTRTITKEVEAPPTSSRTAKIYWNHGGDKVQVTGEFNNWTDSVDMIKDKNNRYFANLPISQSKDIEYKFVVDGEWRFADDLPHRADWNGNINNVLYSEEASHH